MLQEITFNGKLDPTNFLLNGAGNPNKTSDKYKGASSQDLIDAFEQVGFAVRSISKPLARIEENRAFNKHIIRLALKEDIERIKNKDFKASFPEIVIVNNNNNRGALQVMLGIFRLVCTNGMVMGTNFYSDSIRHTGDFYNNLFNSLTNASNNFYKIDSIIDQMKSKELTVDEAVELRSALGYAYANAYLVNKNTVEYRIKSRFNPMRQADMSRDLWTVFNRYQEYYLRHGVSYSRLDKTIDDNGNDNGFRLINGTTRRVAGVDKTIKLNQMLMDTTLNHFNIVA